MTELSAQLANLRRPRLLLRAARFGLSDYRRERDLKRLHAPLNGSEAALRHLVAAEARMEQSRQGGTAGYSLARHIEILIALLAEAGLLRHQSTR